VIESNPQIYQSFNQSTNQSLASHNISNMYLLYPRIFDLDDMKYVFPHRAKEEAFGKFRSQDRMYLLQL